MEYQNHVRFIPENALKLREPIEKKLHLFFCRSMHDTIMTDKLT